MHYNAFRHTLEEDNGKLIAVFDESVRADDAFEIADYLEQKDHYFGLQGELDGCHETIDEFQDDIRDLKQEKEDLQSQVDKLDDRLQSIINMIECSYKNDDPQEILEESVSLCSSPLSK
jgi:predicted nuclease with TOPRIM domain